MLSALAFELDAIYVHATYSDARVGTPIYTGSVDIYESSNYRGAPRSPVS